MARRGTGALLDASVHVAMILHVAEARGIPAGRLLRRVPVEPGVLGNPLCGLPFATVAALLERGVALSGDEAFGLHMGEALRSLHFGLPGYHQRHAPSVGEMMQERCRLLGRLVTAVCPSLEVRDGRAWFRVAVHAPLRPAVRHLVEFHMAACVGTLRRYAAIDAVPEAVRFRHGPPRHREAYGRLLGCRPVFGAPRNELELDAGWLLRPVRGADSELRSALGPVVAALESALPEAATTAAQVRACLAGLLAGGLPCLSAVAARLGLGPRTVQQRLRHEGTTFQALLDGVRAEAAMALLGDPAETVQSITFRLGFSSAPAFHRAFRRWTGCTPARWRADARHRAPP